MCLLFYHVSVVGWRRTDGRVISCTFSHVQTCDYVRIQSAAEWTPSVHTSHMSKPVITFVFKVLRNGLLPYVLGKSTEKATDKLPCF